MRSGRQAFVLSTSMMNVDKEIADMTKRYALTDAQKAQIRPTVLDNNTSSRRCSLVRRRPLAGEGSGATSFVDASDLDIRFDKWGMRQKNDPALRYEWGRAALHFSFFIGLDHHVARCQHSRLQAG